MHGTSGGSTFLSSSTEQIVLLLNSITIARPTPKPTPKKPATNSIVAFLGLTGSIGSPALSISVTLSVMEAS